MEDTLKLIGSIVAAITAFSGLFAILRNQKGLEERIMGIIKPMQTDINVLKKDNAERTQEESWEKELRKIVSASKEFLSENETLMDFALYKSDKFIIHVMSSMAHMEMSSFDYICKSGGVVLKDCVGKAFRLMGDRFVEEFYNDHIKKAEEYSDIVKSILEDKYNDKKRRVFIESAKFLQAFLRDIHDAYYIIREEEIMALRENE